MKRFALMVTLGLLGGSALGLAMANSLAWLLPCVVLVGLTLWLAVHPE